MTTIPGDVRRFIREMLPADDEFDYIESMASLDELITECKDMGIDPRKTLGRELHRKRRTRELEHTKAMLLFDTLNSNFDEWRVWPFDDDTFMIQPSDGPVVDSFLSGEESDVIDDEHISNGELLMNILTDMGFSISYDNYYPGSVIVEDKGGVALNDLLEIMNINQCK